jgi:hypothetical protein
MHWVILKLKELTKDLITMIYSYLTVKDSRSVELLQEQRTEKRLIEQIRTVCHQAKDKFAAN